MRIEEFEQEKQWWNNREESELAWQVSVEDIKANGFNLDIKNPNVAAEEYKDPETLLKKYREAEAEAEAARNALKFSLIASLEGEEI